MNTKKLLFSIIFIGLITASSWSQSIIEKGDKLISLGYGIGNTLHMSSEYSETYNPIVASFEYGLADGLMENKASIGLGIFSSIAGSEYKYGDEKTKIHDFVIGPKFYFHYNVIDELDTYTGVMLGYNAVLRGKKVAGVADSQMTFRWNVGAKYYLFNHFAVMAELGWGGPILNLGVAYNIKKF